MARAACLLCCLLLCGCTPWQRVDPEPAQALPARRQFLVWVDDHPTRLHALRISADSVTGVPFLQSPDCDSCRVGFRRGQVDSMQTGEAESAGVAWALAPYLVSALVWFLLGAMRGG